MESSERRQNRDVCALAQGLASGNPTIRRASEQLLENADGDVRLQVIRRLTRDIKATKRWMLGVAWAVFVPHLLAASNWRANEERWWWASIALASVGIIVRFALMLGPLQRRIDALTRAVAPVQGPDGCVGLFLEALRCSECYTVETCEALERSVAQVRSGEAGVVTRKQKQWLVQRVVHEWDDAYSLRLVAWEMNTHTRVATTMVRLLAAVGGAQERKQLEQLTRKEPYLEKQRLLQVAIFEVLPGWEARLKEEQASDLLLRAASPPTDSRSLLRPATGVTPTDPQHLLRAGEDPNSR